MSSPRPDAAGGARSARATAIGASAILMWATLALLTTMTGRVPPFQLTALAFAVAFSATLISWILRRGSIIRHFQWPWRAWLVGVGGLFGYHFFYFLALRTAPPAEANLVNYLWPLLIVLFASLLPGERLRWWHMAGALAGLAGSALLITPAAGPTFPRRARDGLRCGLDLCRDVGRLLGDQSPLCAGADGSSGGVLRRDRRCLPASATSLFEQTIWPRGGEWLAVVAMGLGPVGAAFFAWDIGDEAGRHPRSRRLRLPHPAACRRRSSSRSAEPSRAGFSPPPHC